MKTARKLFRQRKAKPGQLLIYWGKLPHDSPDICYAWGGSGADKCDSHLLHGMLSGFGHRKSNPSGLVAHDGFLEELKARGYDLTTLRFSIEQMPLPEPPK